MMYDSLLARSFSKHEQRKLGYGALVACSMLALSICTVFKPYLGPLSVNLKLSIKDGEKLTIVNDTRSSSLPMPVVSETVTANKSIASSTMIPEKIPRSEEPDVTNRTKNSNDTSSSNKIIEELKPVIIEDAPIVNKTSGSERAGGSAMENPIINNNRTKSQDLSDGGEDLTTKKMEIVCDVTGRSDFCDVKGDIRIDPSLSTVYVLASETEKSAAGNRTSWNIRPYARKGDKVAMDLVKEWTVKIVTPQETNLQCTETHSAPAVMFSSAGYSGNHFHSITDIIIPLFATAWPFDRDVELLITNRISHWVAKFETLLKSLSKHEFVDIDKAQGVHCYERMVIGLKGRSKLHKELSIDTSTSAYSIQDFRQFLRNAYSLKKQTAIQIPHAKKRPRLLIVSRRRSRSFTNVEEIARMAKRVGYNVIVGEPNSDMLKSAQIMNSCDVVMGVHGAGLTNMVFMPENSVLIQVVPFGGAEWVSKTYFEEPAKDMNIRYLDYKIKLRESTLIEQYSLNDIVLKHPYEIQKHGWLAFKEIYFDKQNVKLDVIRFRPTLVKALELLHK